MKVVHLCMTPLAGAPIRIVQALNKYTPVQARLINLNPIAYGSRTYTEDLAFRQNPDEARALIEAADLIHLHHWMDLKKNPFGVDLSCKAVLRHFHSEPDFVARHARVAREVIVNDPLPQLVIAQYPERHYPRARMVPNLLNEQELAQAKTTPLPSALPRLLYSPTSDLAAGASRWNTKGMPETLALLHEVQQKIPFEADVFTNLPLTEALRRKSQADAVLDDLVTGSYHLSGLEGLALGKCTFGYLDNRIVAVLTKLTGSTSLPWVNVHLSELRELLGQFLNEPDLFKQAGQYAARWMRENWRSEVLVRHFTTAYDDVLNGMSLLRTDTLHELSDVTLPDIRWLKLTQQLYP